MTPEDAKDEAQALTDQITALLDQRHPAIAGPALTFATASFLISIDHAFGRAKALQALKAHQTQVEELFKLGARQ